MKRERYLADIDRILMDTLRKQSPGVSEKKTIKFSEELIESGQIKKVAFDVYKVDNDPYENIWILENIDGVPHLVRASDPSFESSVKGDWAAVSDHDKRNVTLAYKNTPVARFSSQDYGFSKEDIITFKSALLGRIGDDKEFIKEVLAEQPESKRIALADTFPELRKFV